MTVRQAEPQDIPQIVRMIAHYAGQGLMLPRSASAVETALNNFVVAESGQDIVGCGGLNRYTHDCAELYALATAPGDPPRGTGRALVEALVERARQDSLSTVFALTLAPGFFSRLGFRNVEHRDLPLKVWKDCVACPKFGNCDEIAMVLDVR